MPRERKQAKYLLIDELPLAEKYAYFVTRIAKVKIYN